MCAKKYGRFGLLVPSLSIEDFDDVGDYYEERAEIIKKTGYCYIAYNFHITEEKLEELKKTFRLYTGRRKQIMAYYVCEVTRQGSDLKLTAEEKSHMPQSVYAIDPGEWNRTHTVEWKTRCILKVYEMGVFEEPLSVEEVRNWEDEEASFLRWGFNVVWNRDVDKKTKIAHWMRSRR